MDEYEVFLFFKGNEIGYMDWTDSDIYEVFSDCGLSVVGSKAYEETREEGVFKAYFLCVGEAHLDFSEFKDKLNANIKECGIFDLSIEKVSIYNREGVIING